MPVLQFDTLDAIPEPLRVGHKEVEGKFVIDVVPKANLDEFRENNINLQKERDGLVGRIKGYSEIIGEDFDKFKTDYSELVGIKAKVENRTLVENSSFEKALEQRVTELSKKHADEIGAKDKAISDATAKATALDTKLRRTIIDRHITDAVLHEKSGARADALPDFLGRAYEVFKVDETGNLTPYEGETVIYGADTKPMKPIEWITTKVRERSPYLFKDSNGGGAGGGSGGGATRTINIQDRDALNASLEDIASGKVTVTR